ncbi:HAMP domain-containing histidine kinase [Candidatus Roizmanbacteria bacterium]|nr:HAMP domain-containing histidine kinase [Candidatus Roizmanbacteria bacterium]
MDTFQKARLKLTFWYCIICIFLLAVFSLAALKAERLAFNRIETVLSDPIQRPRLTALLEQRIRGFEDNFKQQLLLFDALLLIIAAASSYFLSGVTLDPIQAMMKKQQDFAADASHELRTPLTTIKMEVEALERTEKRLPFSQKNVFDSILEEANRMSAIVDGLLTLVRTGSLSRQTFHPVELTQVALEAYQQIKVLSKQKNIVLTYHHPDQIFIHGIRDQLKEMLLVLLDNAVKYTTANGQIQLQIVKKPTGTQVAVKDTGIGIAEEERNHVFERFFRGSHAKTKVPKGAGLGLAIARTIAETHHATITVQSEIGKGTAFTITFPKQPFLDYS